MPTTRPRHVITETDTVARALDDAAKQWPENRDSRARLLLRLIAAGHQAVLAEHARIASERREAVARTSGIFPGLYGEGYLDELRKDWPA